MADQTAQLSDVSQNGWLATAKRVKDEIANDNVGLIAAGCAFYALMAIFPGIVLPRTADAFRNYTLQRNRKLTK